jgi:ubiquinone/menaquinone biosynthesis C-methylase UbiE
MNEAEEIVKGFYDKQGWNTKDSITEDAKLFEDLRNNAKEYVSKCRLRVCKHIPEKGEFLLDMASGPIQYEEYLEYSKNFTKRYCVDLSKQALESAQQKIGDHGVFLCGSFFDLSLQDDFFDCSISLHTIYHIDKDMQEEAIRKLIRVTKSGKPVIIVYSNPDTLMVRLRRSIPYRVLRKVKHLFVKAKPIKKMSENDIKLYFCAHSLKWWDRFSDSASVKIYPWRSFGSDMQKKLIPDNILGRKLFAILFWLEEKFPNFFVKYFTYPMIVLTKIEKQSNTLPKK